MNPIIFRVHVFCMRMLCIQKKLWCMYKYDEIFHCIYMCIIHVLNTQHSCAKNKNSWKNDFCIISIIKSWVGKFVMQSWLNSEDWIHLTYTWSITYAFWSWIWTTIGSHAVGGMMDFKMWLWRHQVYQRFQAS
jgi:hypothetical protein